MLESLRNGKRYVGSTSKAPETRLREHNSGSNRWTRQNRPFKLVYYEECQSRADAIRRERFLKSGAGRRIRDDLASDFRPEADQPQAEASVSAGGGLASGEG
ncbi:MAG: GIY-YIG nuclease family protein [Dehalococcoidia bacterium]|nr:GIY-YIG nuclease family protein [Dehalococcoidia bacterium]